MLRMPRRWAAVLPLLAVLAAGPACVQQPVVTVHHAEVGGLSAFGVSVTVFLQIRNDNAYDVQIRSVHCNVTFGRGYTLGPIDFAPPQGWLPAGQTTLIPVPVSIPWNLLPALASETVGAFAVPYHVRGVANVTATRTFGIERDNYPVDEGGAIPRQALIDVARRSIPLPF